MSCISLPSPTRRQLASVIRGPLSPACLLVGHQRVVSTPNKCLAVFPLRLLIAKVLRSHWSFKCDPIYTWLQLAEQHGSPGGWEPILGQPKGHARGKGFLTVLWGHSTDSKLRISG